MSVGPLSRQGLRDLLIRQPLFAPMALETLDSILRQAETRVLQPGEVLFAENQSTSAVYVIVDGEIEILRRVGMQEVPLANRGVGDVVGEMSVLTGQPRNATVRASAPTTLISIAGDTFMCALRSSPEAIIVVLQTMIARLQSAEMELVQHQKMAALGVLAAGLAHELNNPASAVERSAKQLQDAVVAWESAAERLGKSDLRGDDAALLAARRKELPLRAAEDVWLDPIERSDREQRIQSWLQVQGFAAPWLLSPALVDAGLDIDELRQVETVLSRHGLAVILEWIGTGQTVMSLLHKLTVSAHAISEIVAAVKAYTRLDQAPIQSVDIHEGLDQSLTILRYKLRSIGVHRQYAPDIPPMVAFASELNQVWTNLIDNAADAMAGEGDLTIRTYADGRWIFVEIEDTGPGISETARDRLFEPFYTTKPPGQGTGMGLAIAYSIVRKHAGEIRVKSRPGLTTFVVCLPAGGVSD